jgi:hypothetical protein
MVVVALLDDHAVLEDSDAAGVSNRRQSVCYRQNCPSLGQVLESFLDELLGHCVEGGRGLVKD